MERCSKCGLEKDDNEFYKNKIRKNGLCIWCKKCSDNNSKKFVNKRREHKLKIRFNITLDQYNEMFIKQGGVCAICKKAETAIDPRTNKPRNLAVDHVHPDGPIRGLLCQKCNMLIGLSKDDPQTLRNAANYLENNIKE